MKNLTPSSYSYMSRFGLWILFFSFMKGTDRPHSSVAFVGAAVPSLATASVTTGTVTELDGIRFRNALQAQTGETPNDLLVLFYDSSIVPSPPLSPPPHPNGTTSTPSLLTATCTRNTLPYLVRTMDQVTQRLRAKDAIQIAMYDIHTHGIPAGLHLHNHEDDGVWLLLFPTPEANHPDDVIVYKYRDDVQNSYDRDIDGTMPCSVSSVGMEGNNDGDPTSSPSSTESKGETIHHVHPNGETCTHPHHHDDKDDDHDHHHHDHPATVYPRYTIRGILRWLKTHSTFPGDIPYINEVSIADKYKDRSNELWIAVSKGLQALQQQMNELEEENKQLRKELEKCRTKGQE